MPANHWGLLLMHELYPRNRRLLTRFLAAVLLFSSSLFAATTDNRLVWENGDGFRRAKLNVPAEGKAGFTLLAPETTGILWTNKLSVERVLQRQNLMNGAGVAA